MSSEWAQKTKLTRLVMNAVGLLIFDENCNVIEASGVGKDRLADIVTISQNPVGNEGFGALEGSNLKAAVYQRDGKTVVVYTALNS
ncbi:LAME_0H15478g1_1 [Lachancea meyersii CBS 8951]|uniref:LAME_0H15478g1_1 n=1 Tax=Lachancea meyersii CBS 8951 TaxID=1266667 RepID=A0A1G4KHV1_9SACH|nr:LAME_0H15478g1_1 [Lachancea meyersii CBS 8951]